MYYLRALTCLLFVAACCSQGWAQAYPIKVSPPDHQGDLYLFSAELNSRGLEIVTLDGEEVLNQPQGGQLSIDAIMEIVEVDASGITRLIDFHIRKCRGKLESGRKVSIRKGRTLQLQITDSGPKFAIDKGKISDDLLELLEFLGDFGPGQRSTGKSPFATDTPQRIGDRWPVNPQTLAQELSDANVYIDPSDVQGEMVLQAVREVDGIRCLRVHGEVHVRKFTFPIEAGFRPVSSSINIKLEGDLPLDSPCPIIQGRTEISARAELIGEDTGQGIPRLRFESNQIIETRTERIPYEKN